MVEIVRDIKIGNKILCSEKESIYTHQKRNLSESWVFQIMLLSVP